MADIAAIFHWTPEQMDPLSLEELVYWRNAAVRTWNQMNAPGKG
ncbi:hypothetical protein M2336_001905 [Sphingobium sp. B1D7B]|nr:MULTISPECIES: GpE family phage tail protein [Sphingobium]MCW2362439.1 hypothetical protein [Sphingobium sp. B10D3B]MCW2370189.1 hypothetical protein [Sphingobium sp. B11D3D]MCW2395166.1 hypothetical protein [Sphingobium sp. B8D3B]MCW2400881.1 hypothetical protein [Sphingobium sp. B10D7B]MCW2405276.1 hypothetical protein [Sphingobium sp. B1D7B]